MNLQLVGWHVLMEIAMRWVSCVLIAAVPVVTGCSDGGNGAAEDEPAPASTPADEAQAPADPLLEPVSAAREAFASRVLTAKAALESQIEAHIRDVAEGGDPVLVKEAMEERDRFMRTGAVPADPALAVAVERYEQEMAQAQVELAGTLQTAVEKLTRELRVEEAMALRDEARRLRYEADAVLPDDAAEPIDGEPMPEVAGADPELFPGLGEESGEGAGAPEHGDEGEGEGDEGGSVADDPAPARPYDDPIAEALALAEDAYLAEVEASRQTLLSRIDARVEALRGAEDVARAEALSAEQARFREHGMLPTDAAMRSAVRRHVVEAGRALRTYARSASQVVADYLSADRPAEADRVQAGLQSLRDRQAFYEAIAEARAGSLPREAYRFEAAGAVSRVAVSGNGLLLAVWSGRGVIQVWSLATGELVSSFDAPMPSVSWLSLSSDGSVIGASCWEHTGKVWLIDGTLVADYNESRDRYNIAVAEDGQHIVIGGNFWVTLKRVDGAGVARNENVIADNYSAYNVNVSSIAGVMVSGGYHDQIRVYGLDSRTHERTLACERTIMGMFFAPDGSHLVACSSSSGLYVWETETFERVQQVSGLPDAPRWMSMSNGGRLLLANLDRGWVFETATGRKLYEVGVAGGYHVVTPDGAFVLGSDGEEVVLYRLPSR